MQMRTKMVSISASSSILCLMLIGLTHSSRAQLLSLDQLQLLSPRVHMIQAPSLGIASIHSNQAQQRQQTTHNVQHGTITSTSDAGQPLASIQYELKILQQKPLILDVTTATPSYSLPSSTSTHEAMASESRGTSSESVSRLPVKKILHIHHYHHEHPTGYELDEATTRAQEKQQEKATEAMVEKQVQEIVVKNFERKLQREEEHGDSQSSDASDSDDSAVDHPFKEKHTKLDVVEEQWKPIPKFKQTFSYESKVNRGSNSIDNSIDSAYHEDYAPYAHFHQQARSNTFGQRQHGPKPDSYSEIQKTYQSGARRKTAPEFRPAEQKYRSEATKAKQVKENTLHKRSKRPGSFDLDLDDNPRSFDANGSSSSGRRPESMAREQKVSDQDEEHDDSGPRFSLQNDSAEDERSGGDGNDYGFSDESDSGLGALDNFHSDSRPVARKSHRTNAVHRHDRTTETHSEPRKSIKPVHPANQMGSTSALISPQSRDHSEFAVSGGFN